MMFTRILVPLDGSDIAQAALPYALSFADAVHGSITLLQSVPPLHVTWDYYVPYDAAIEAERLAHTGKDLDALAERLRSPARQIETGAVVGDPAEEILSHADRTKTDLIAMTTHGRGGIAHWAFGSVARRVLTAATVPTLIVRPKGSPAHPGQPAAIRRLLVPLDGSDLAATVLPLVRELAQTLGAEVTLVRVLAPPPLTGAIAHAIVPQPAYIDRVSLAAREDAEAYLARTGADLASFGVTTSSLMPTGDAAAEMLQILGDGIYDLVVMTTHGRTGIQRWALGSVAERLVETSHTPVLLLRSAASAAQATFA